MLRRLSVLPLMLAPAAFGQKGSPPPAPTSTSPPPSRAAGGAYGGFNSADSISFSSLVVFGSVTLPDGAAPGELVMVERACKGIIQTAGFADSKGRFSFDLGVLNEKLDGAGVLSSNQLAANRISPAELMDCEVRASLSGYRSENVSLKAAASGRRPQLGTIVLKPVGKEEAPVLSASDAQAPKNAKKAYEKGLDAASKAKWQEAVEAFKEATSRYPKYASAWLSLGLLQAGGNNTAAATESYAQAIAADGRFALPYLQSALLDSLSEKWERVIEFTDKVIEIDPGSFPQAYQLNGMANLSLNRVDVAEKSAAAGIGIDTEHRFPELEYIEGVALLRKHDTQGAAKHLESYLGIAPRGPNAPTAQQQLAALSKTR